MKIYLCRHGETEWNKENRIQGNVNIPLNEAGINLAKQTKLGFDQEGLAFDKVYSSTLDRAIQTAQILCGHDNIKKDSRICEIDFGVYEGEPVPMTLPDDEHFKNLFQCFQNPHAYVPKGGESYEQVIKRANDFLSTEVYQETNLDQTVLIAAHGGIIRALVGIIENQSLENFWTISQPNLSVNILEYNGQRIQILQLGKLYY